MIRTFAAVATLAVAGSAFAQVDINLGTIGEGLQFLSGTTAGATNDIDTYGPVANSAAKWTGDIIYSFTLTQSYTFEMISQDPNSNPDNDFFLLSSLSTTTLGNGFRQATVVPQQTVVWEIDSQGPAFTLTAGTYYFVVDAWFGNPSSSAAQERGGAYSAMFNLVAVPTPAAAALLGIGGLAATRRRRAR